MLPASVRIFVCLVPQDMRRSFDTLALATREVLKEDPQSGALFVFVGKRPTRIKVLWWDRNGYCLLYKRLHAALFVVPNASDPAAARVQIDATAFAELLAGVQKQKTSVKRLTRALH
ncbi:MAG: IS66 family insertion sequence element accessory protein TnpB [Deltaproteobacteria bacterium]|nr:IS66 family insertion sequence element accessory protein TnpB [Deltaproteobacteria bacterium]